jgi:hypothetical protein
VKVSCAAPGEARSLKGGHRPGGRQILPERRRNEREWIERRRPLKRKGSCKKKRGKLRDTKRKGKKQRNMNGQREREMGKAKRKESEKQKGRDGVRVDPLYSQSG